MNSRASSSGGVGPSGGRRTLGPRRPTVRLTAPGSKPSARRCLFGPVDHQETDDSLKEINRRIDEQKREQWGFDFKAGRPVPGGHPVYEWEPVDGSDDIPSVYGRMVESWRDPGIVGWANEKTEEMRGLEGADICLDSHRWSERSRKRLRRLSPDLDTALSSACSNAGDRPDHGLDKSVAEAGCSGAVELDGASRPVDDKLPPKDLRKSEEEKLENHSSLKPSDVPVRLEGSGCSVVCSKVVDLPKEFPTTMDNGVVALPNPSCDAVPEEK